MTKPLVVCLALCSAAALAPRAPAAAPAAAPSPELLEKIRADNAAAARENPLIEQANAARAKQDWPGAVDVLQKLIALTPRWPYLRALAEAKGNLGAYAEAADGYAAALRAARAVKPAPGEKERLSAAIEGMLVSEGNMNLKRHKNPEAMKLYAEAAESSKNPARAAFNLCATAYNVGDAQTAKTWCRKAIAADPRKADAYFVEGSILFADGTTTKDNKFLPVPGTIEDLRKYLELAPGGAHANDVKEMLKYAGAPAEAK
jgi:tetratricopeptide (TPR) repeat protein